MNVITKYWSGDFEVFGYKIHLNCNVKEGYVRGIRVKLVNSLGVSNVRFPKGRWSVGKFGYVTIFRGDSRSEDLSDYSMQSFMWVAAHEFGHLLGVYDAYTKENPPKSIFNEFGTLLQNKDLEKVLYAFIYNSIQSW